MVEVNQVSSDQATSQHRLQTPQEIDRAVAMFKASEWQGDEVMKLWQTIREAALAQFANESSDASVAGADSY